MPSDAPISFKDFSLDECILEMRYEQSFLFWDNSGKIFHELRSKLPHGEFELRGAEPGGVTILYAGEFQITVESQRLAVTAQRPETFNRFADVIEVVYQVVCDRLKIEQFSRVGMRQIFAKTYKHFDDAKSELRRLLRPTIPSGITLDSSTSVVIPSLQVRLEDEYRGTLIFMHANSRGFRVDIPPLFRKSFEKVDLAPQQHAMLLDIDSYTKKTVRTDQLSIRDWAAQQHDLAKKNASAVITWTK